ncbi:MAG: PEP-CTERM sorting domain-containing protein [Sedimentisphaerales bacterium]|nr:PEP-CTERM sorting domain-containing protein [Sedimentisphaerales bacterium]
MLSRNNLPLSNGAPLGDIFWHLYDPTGSAFSSADLSTTAPVLSGWQSNVLGFGADRKYGISAHVISAVPEPATIFLFGIGGLLFARRQG